MRIFSHTCSNTEIVCALGCADQLIGVDADSDYPPNVVAALPKTGRDLDLNIEDTLALKPDLVLTSLTVPGHETVVAALQKTDVQTLVCDPVSLDDVYSDIRRIAAALNVHARGDKLVADMQAEMPATTAATRPSILVEWWPKPVIVPARQSWVTDIIYLAGGRNPWADTNAKSLPIKTPAAVAANPDAIVMSWCGVKVEKYRADVVLDRQGWNAVTAIQNKQVHAISEAFLGRPGPRLVEGYRQLRHVISSVTNT